MFRIPGEWTPHEAVWLAWPFDEKLWGEDLSGAQEEFLALLKTIADLAGNQKPRGERLKILVPNEKTANHLQTELDPIPADFFIDHYGDIWLRDTAPLFSNSEARAFQFNGWGNKYLFKEDRDLSKRIARHAGKAFSISSLIAEGGAFDWDGEGHVLSTKNCLLHPERNANWSREEIEVELQSFGAKKLILLEAELKNDHTDGHIDTLARFASPGNIILMKARDSNDPNQAVLESLARQLEVQKDLSGKAFKLHFIPSPGLVANEQGDTLPASYLNFYISNTRVIVPTYGSSHDDEAVRQIGELFPDRETLGLSSRSILTGGGAFHCITQQEV